MNRSTVFATFAFLVLGAAYAAAHDDWISRGGFMNQAEEGCCGLGDCFALDSSRVLSNAQGYILLDYGNEIVPYSEALPSPDGTYWRCKRADGSLRCFFAPPPNT